MSSSQTFNVIKASLNADNSSGSVVQTLDLLITAQPQMVNGQPVPSSYVLTYEIAAPTSAQIAAYTPTSSKTTPTLTLTTDV